MDSKTDVEVGATCEFCRIQPATHTTRYARVYEGYGRMVHQVAACERCKASFERKNAYMSCVVGERFDTMTPQEQAQALKAAYWADLLTNAEWPVVMRHEGVAAPTRSKLKKKIVGWVIALSHVAQINREFAAQVLRDADARCREQFEREPPIPWALLADLIEQGWTQSGLEAWLQPLRNLRSFGPAGLARLVEELASEDDYEAWLPSVGNEDVAA